MTDARTPPDAALPRSLLVQDARTRSRNAAETRFKAYGVAAIAIAVVVLSVLLFTIIRDGSGAFVQTYLAIPVTLDAAVVDPKGNRDPAEMAQIFTMSYGKLLDSALETGLTPTTCRSKA